MIEVVDQYFGPVAAGVDEHSLDAVALAYFLELGVIVREYLEVASPQFARLGEEFCGRFQPTKLHHSIKAKVDLPP